MVLLGDSNARSLTGLPARVTVVSIRGARFPHLKAILGRIEGLDQVKCIAFAAGINYRQSDDLNKDFRADLDDLLGTEGLEGKHIALVGVNIPASTPEREADNVARINRDMEQWVSDGIDYVPCLKDYFIGDTGDSVHYNQVTAAAISDHLNRHFFS